MLIVFSVLLCLAPAQEVPPGRAARELALDTFSARQTELVDEAITSAELAIKSPQSRADAAYYIRLLGRMRSPRAAEFLVNNLTFQPLAGDIAVSITPSIEGSLPCVYSLSEIGSASFPTLLTKLQESDDDFVHRCGALVFRESLGADQAAVYLHRAAAKLPVGPRHNRVEAVAKWAEKIK